MSASKSTALPRVPFEEMSDALVERLEARVERLGYLGEFFQIGALQPESLAAFIDYSEAAKASLPAGIVEVVALTTADVLGSEYERNQHEHLALALGYPREWVAAVESKAPEDAPALAEPERIVQRYVLTALKLGAAAARREFDAVVHALGPKRSIGVLFLLGRYMAHSLFVVTLGIPSPVSSIWKDSDGD